MSDLSWSFYESEPAGGGAMNSPPMPTVQSLKPQAPEALPVAQPPTYQTAPSVQKYSDGVKQGMGLNMDMIQNYTGGAQEVYGQEKGPEVFVEKQEKLQDIGNYKNYKDLLYIFVAILVVDVIVIFLTRMYPEVMGRNLNRWYDLFGLNSVIADVFIIGIGFLIARFVYTKYVRDRKEPWNFGIFSGVLVAVQVLHDIIFYKGIIEPIPRNKNAMLDVMKDYAESGGSKILFGDALMMVGSGLLASVFKGMSYTSFSVIGIVTTYVLPYLLYTQNEYTIH